MAEKTDPPRRYDDYRAWAAGLAIGVVFALILGFSTGNPALFIGIGVALGVSFAIIFHGSDFDRFFKRTPS